MKHLARALETRCALVAELVEPEHTQLRVLSAWDGDDHVTLGDAPLADTIMRDVLKSGMQFYGPSGSALAEDSALADLAVSNCAAISLQDTSGRAIGVLAVAGDRPLRLDDNLVSTLRVFAATAGVAPAPEYLRVDQILECFDRDVDTARRRYVEFVLSEAVDRHGEGIVTASSPEGRLRAVLSG